MSNSRTLQNQPSKENDNEGLRDAISTDDCWLWATYKKKEGYGQIGGEDMGIRWNANAHRALYEVWVGEIPRGYDVDHLCKIPACINPAHLEAVTHKENMQRRYGVGLCKRGHKLTDDNVCINVRRDTGRTWRQCKQCQVVNQAEYWVRKGKETRKHRLAIKSLNQKVLQK